MVRILVISDPHLSPTHGFFWENWRRACEAANRLSLDAVIVSGDLCINGPDSDASRMPGSMPSSRAARNRSCSSCTNPCSSNRRPRPR